MKLNIFNLGYPIFVFSLLAQLIFLSGFVIPGNAGLGVIICFILLIFNLTANGTLILVTFKDNGKKVTTVQKFLMGLALFFASSFPLVPMFCSYYLAIKNIVFVWFFLPSVFLSITKLSKEAREKAEMEKEGKFPC